MDNVAGILKYAAKVIREQEQKNQALLETIETKDKEEQFRKLANVMAQKGLISYENIDDKIESLINSGKDPMIVEQAIELALTKKASIIEDTFTDIKTSKDPRAKILQVLLDEEDED